MKISFYKNTFGDKLQDLDLLTGVLKPLKEGDWLSKIFKLRVMLDKQGKEAYKAAKKKLPCFTPSGTFELSQNSTGKICPPMAKDLIKYNQLVLVDLKELNSCDIETVLANIKGSLYTFVAFRSTDGNGIKVLVKVNGSQEQHLAAATIVNEYYAKLTGQKIEKNDHHINRLCSISSDANLFINEEAKVFGTAVNALLAKNNVSKSGIYNQYIQQKKRALTLTALSKDSTSLTTKPKKIKLDKKKEAQKDPFALPYEDFEEKIESLNVDSKTRKEMLRVFFLEKYLKKDFDFRYNIIREQFQYKPKKSKRYSFLQKKEYNSLRRFLLAKGNSYTTREIKNCVESDFSPKQNPLKELFKAWGKLEDKTDYIAKVAATVKTTSPKGFWEICFKKWLVASVANVFVDNENTNCYCPVLIGKSISKTKFFHALWPKEYPEYFCCGKRTLSSQSSELIDAFLILLDEKMAAIKNQNNWEKLKGLIHLDRPQRHRNKKFHTSERGRIANFCGSVNPTNLLPKSNNNTCFLTFEITQPIDLPALENIDIQKMWGQAYRLYLASQKGNFNYWLTDEEQAQQMTNLQEKFKKHKLEARLLAALYQPATEKNKDDFLSTTAIHKILLHQHSEIKIISLPKLGAALIAQGFIRQKRTVMVGTTKKRVFGWYVKRVV